MFACDKISVLYNRDMNDPRELRPRTIADEAR